MPEQGKVGGNSDSDTNVCLCLCLSVFFLFFCTCVSGCGLVVLSVLSVLSVLCVCVERCVCVFSGVGNVLFSTCSQTLNGHDQVVASGASDNSAWAILGKRKIGDEG